MKTFKYLTCGYLYRYPHNNRNWTGANLKFLVSAFVSRDKCSGRLQHVPSRRLVLPPKHRSVYAWLGTYYCSMRSHIRWCRRLATASICHHDGNVQFPGAFFQTLHRSDDSTYLLQKYKCLIVRSKTEHGLNGKRYARSFFTRWNPKRKYFA